MSILKQIEDKIVEHEKAIAALTIAHGVVLSLAPSEPKANKSGSSAKHSTQNPKAKKVDTVRGEVRGIILTTMNNMVLPATSKEIWQAVVQRGSNLPQKRIWNALYVMKDKGTIVRDDEGNYSFPSPDVGNGTISDLMKAAG